MLRAMRRGRGEGEGEGSLYDYGDDSFAPYESQGAGKTEGEGERKVGTEEPSARLQSTFLWNVLI
jgi:hypothetical protein